MEKKNYDSNYVQFKLKYNKEHDADVIEFLRGLDNKQGLIRELLKKEMKKRK